MKAVPVLVSVSTTHLRYPYPHTLILHKLIFRFSMFGSKASLEELMEGGGTTSLSMYDEAALCSSAFKSVKIYHKAVKKPVTCKFYACFQNLLQSGTNFKIYRNILFRILRGMVHTWLHEVSTNQNFYADLQLQHFYRYTMTSSLMLIPIPETPILIPMHTYIPIPPFPYRVFYVGGFGVRVPSCMSLRCVE